LVYENPWLKVYEHEIKRRESTGIYGVVEREHSVVIIPLSPSNRTVLLKQYRYPTDADSWELPMGGIGANENKEKALQRELAEETGLQALDYKEIGEYHPVPGLTPQRVSVFIVSVTDTELERAFASEEADEIQAVRVLSLLEIYEMVEKGDVTDGFTLVSLLYLKLHIEAERLKTETKPA
jgi:8-oxo-dGTP pyrophosphatase MutT (NUDIX family)